MRCPQAASCSARQLDLIDENGARPARPLAKGKGGGGRGRGKGGSDEPQPPPDANLADEAQRRHLNYAVSVITACALPDVRDGHKPVQRRILFAMHNDLHVYPGARFRKSATIRGQCVRGVDCSSVIPSMLVDILSRIDRIMATASKRFLGLVI